MSQEYRPPVPATRRTGRILLLLWAVLAVSQLGYVLTFGHNQPWADEWEFVPTLTGHEPEETFYFARHNEHRLPLPRAIYFGLWQLTHDFRAGMVLQVALLSVMALRGMQLAARLRGRADWADAFFPLSLLHVGHCENLLMGYQLCFVVASGFAFCVLELVLRRTPENAGRTVEFGAFVTLALCLSGGFGIVLAGPIGIWVLFLLTRNGRRNWPASAWAVVYLSIALVYLGYVFTTYERPPDHPPFEWKNWFASLQVAGQFLAIGLGIGVGGVWFAVLPLIGLACVVAARGIRGLPIGIFAVGCSVILLSVAIGAGRGGFGSQMGLWPRYSVLAWPLLAAIFLTAANHRWLPRSLAIAAMLAFLPNTLYGLDFARRHDGELSDIARQLYAGQSTADIVEESLRGGQAERARQGIPMLRDAKIGPFADWKGSP